MTRLRVVCGGRPERSAGAFVAAAAAVAAGWISNGSVAHAEQATPADVLWHRAMVDAARGEGDPRAATDRACDAGSPAACLSGAADAVEAGDLEHAEDLLRAGRDAAPEDPDLRLALARVMAARGNHHWAARELQALEAEGAPVAFELGLCMFLLGLYEEAAETLTRAADAGGDNAGMAALYAAAALDRLERREEAERMARLAARTEGDPELAAAGGDYLRVLRGGRAAAERVLVRAWATVSGGYDSNPVLGPDDAPTHAGGARLWFRAGVAGEPLGGAFWALGGVVAASRDQSFEASARPFDYTSVRAQAAARFFWGLDAPQEVSVGYRFAIGLLDGGPGVERDELYAYNESHLAAASYSLRLSPALLTRFRASTGWSIFHNRARTGVPLDLGVGESVILLDGRLKLYLEGGFRAAWTRSPKYDRAGPTVLLAASWLTPWWGLEVLGTWSLAWTLYPHSSGVEHGFDYARPELRRRDMVNGLALGLGRALLDGHVRLALQYRLTDSASSIAGFDYTRHVAELAVTGGY